MSIVRTALHLLLSLALVAGGMVPDMAAAAGEMEGASAAIVADGPPCHESASPPAEPAAPDVAPGCCDGRACACDCMHHAPVAMVTVPRLPAAPAGSMLSTFSEGLSPSPSPSPSLRPPIA